MTRLFNGNAAEMRDGHAMLRKSSDNAVPTTKPARKDNVPYLTREIRVNLAKLQLDFAEKVKTESARWRVCVTRASYLL
jgi:hypothetical protein